MRGANVTGQGVRRLHKPERSARLGGGENPFLLVRSPTVSLRVRLLPRVVLLMCVGVALLPCRA